MTGLYRLTERENVNPSNSQYVAKLYEKMQYPEQRAQINVNFTPEICLAEDAKGKKGSPYTATEKYLRFRYSETFEEYGTYSSTIFLEHILARAPFQAECVQTDNGVTKRRDNTNSQFHMIQGTPQTAGTSSSRLIHRGTTARVSAANAKAMNIFTHTFCFLIS